MREGGIAEFDEEKETLAQAKKPSAALMIEKQRMRELSFQTIAAFSTCDASDHHGERRAPFARLLLLASRQ